jgi:hypothetical protein
MGQIFGITTDKEAFA